MTMSTYLMTAVLVAGVVGGSACSRAAMDDTKQDANHAADATKTDVDRILDATKKAGDEAGDATKDLAQTAADQTKAVAGDIAAKSQDAAAATGKAVTDSWITTKIKAKFADAPSLEGSDISVETTEHVVTLKGTVPSRAAKTQAAAIARETERVTRVDNQLLVSAR
jgi:hyperosmotically inducible protein